MLARRLLKLKRESRAAVRIQSAWRTFVARRTYLNVRVSIVKLQARCRGYLARKNRELVVLNQKATLIQAHVRGFLARRRYDKVIRGITLCQAHFRRRKARKIFKDMKIEARSVEHQKQLNKGLENKIISLQQQIEKIVSRITDFITKLIINI
jgi:myosin-5